MLRRGREPRVAKQLSLSLELSIQNVIVRVHVTMDHSHFRTILIFNYRGILISKVYTHRIIFQFSQGSC